MENNRYLAKSAVLATFLATTPVGLTPRAYAQSIDTTSSSGTITLEQVLQTVEKNNPEILAARKRWEASQSKVVQEATLDKPRLDVERMYAPAGQSVINNAAEKNLVVTQEVPFPSTLYLRRSRATKEAEMAEQSYLAKVRAVLARARSAYAMLFLSYKSLEIFDENVGIMRRFGRVAEAKYAAGRATQLDAIKAHVELTKMLNMSFEIAQEKETTQSMLNALLNRDAQSPLGSPLQPEASALKLKFEDLKATALAQRPELREAFLAAQRADKSLALAKSEYLPDFMLQYRWRNDAMRGKSNDAMLGLSVPLWFWKPAAMVREAQAEKEMSEAELQTMKVMTTSELKTAWVRTETARHLADAYQTSVLPQAQEALTIAEAGYQSDKGSFLDLLDAQRSLLNFRLEYYQYLTAYEQRLAELERIVGKELRTP